MTAISHLLITLPNHARTAQDPKGLGRLQYTRDKQIDTRATAAFMRMLHPGVNYRLQQIVADRSHINFDTVPGIAERYLANCCALEQKIADLDHMLSAIQKSEARTAKPLDAVTNLAAWAFVQHYREVRADLVGRGPSSMNTRVSKAVQSFDVKTLKTIRRSPLDQALAPHLAQKIESALLRSDITSVFEDKMTQVLSDSDQFDREQVMDAFIAGAVQAMAVLAKNKLTKLDIELMVGMIGCLLDKKVLQQPTILSARHPHFRPDRILPQNTNGIILGHRMAHRLGNNITEFGDVRAQCFAQAYRRHALVQEKQRLTAKKAETASAYPGDLALGKPFAGTQDIKAFRNRMLAYAHDAQQHAKTPPDIKNIVRACLAIIDRQLIPGGNPALAADFMRLLHLLLCIEQIKRGELDVGIYTDPDSQAGLAMMTRLSHANQLGALKPLADKPDEILRADLKASALQLARRKNGSFPRGCFPCGTLRALGKQKELPFELYATHIMTPVKDSREKRWDEPCFRRGVGRYYSDYDVGSMHVSGRPANRGKLDEAQAVLLDLLRVSVQKYNASFKAVTFPQAPTNLFSGRRDRVAAQLEAARDLGENAYLCRSVDPLKQALAQRPAQMSLGDLGRSIHHILPLSLDRANSDHAISAGEALVVFTVAEVVLASVPKTNPVVSQVEAALYPLKQKIPMAKLRSDFFECFYESSWRNRDNTFLPITERLVQRLADDRAHDRGSAITASRACEKAGPLPAVANTGAPPGEGAGERLSADTSDLPTYLLDSVNRGL